MSDAERLFGSRAIVTGAASGIGEAIVRTLVKHGASVVAVDRKESGVDRQFRKLRGVTPHIANVIDRQSAEEMVKAAARELGGLDVVVNSSSVQASKPIGSGDDAELKQFLDRKIQAFAAVSRAALPFLEKSPAGRIVNIGCVRSSFSRDGDEYFERSETAVAEFTRALAAETAANGITVNYIQPGAVMTPDSRRIFADDKELRDYCIRRSAARRLGEPVDIAKVALFLASDDAVFVSGTGIVVDGGRA